MAKNGMRPVLEVGFTTAEKVEVGCSVRNDIYFDGRVFELSDFAEIR